MRATRTIVNYPVEWRSAVGECSLPTPPRNAIVNSDMGQRLDEEKLDQLRTWGAGLAASSDQELRATGKAILLLIEEIEALHVELWNERARATAEPMPAWPTRR